MKSQFYRAAILTALGLAGASVQAQSVGTVSVNGTYAPGDLLVGIYQPGDPNTTVLDIGSVSSLANGETWSLGSYLTTAGITLGAGAEYGVIGTVNASSSDKRIYLTQASGSPTPVSGTANFNTYNSAIGTIGGYEGPQPLSGGNDWYNNTINTANSSGQLVNLGVNPNAFVGSPDLLYTLQARTGTPETPDLSFNLNDAGTLTYGTVSAVPEPASYGLIAAAGLLIVSLRNKLSRKQA